MRSNFNLRTFMLLVAWLFLQNFNVAHKVDGAVNNGTCGGKSMETTCSLLVDRCSLFVPSLPASINSPFAGAEQQTTINQQRSTNSESHYKIKTIVLDAGHGGKDPGCAGATSKEKDNALAIVLQLGALIEANFPDVKVIYTRDSDVFVELNERAAIANRNNADLFICVHCNAMSTSVAHGAETYVLGLHKAEQNLAVAMRENASIYLEDDYEKNYEGYDPNSPEALILGSTWQSAYLEQSILLAQYVQQFAAAEALRVDRGVKQAGFLVLKETAMPSVLIETGYLTNPAEDEYLASSEGQEQMSLAIFKAIRAYKDHMETGKSAVVTAKPASAKPVAQKASTPQNTSKATVVMQKETVPAKKPAPPPAPVFRICLLAWPNRLDPNVGQMSLLTNVQEELFEGKYHYYLGNYNTQEDAEKVLPEIKNLGFKTARIVKQMEPLKP